MVIPAYSLFKNRDPTHWDLWSWLDRAFETLSVSGVPEKFILSLATLG
jgi:hypothetical protein